MPTVDNLIYEETTTTGTGNKALAGLTGFRRFASSFGTGGTDVFYYFIRHKSADEWEWGSGHLDGVTGELVSDSVENGSAGAGVAVNFTSGVKEVTCDYIAERVNADSSKLAGVEAGAQVNPADTDALSEGTINLYYTDLRVNSRIDARVDKAFVDALNVDADTLDGNDSTAFALSGHGHSNATTTVDGFMSSGDKSKLNGIESGATGDQSATEIKTSYESNADTNAYTDSEKTKLTGIESGAQVNPSDTDALAEGINNLYYTDVRVNGRIDARVDKAFVDALNVDADTLDGNDSSAFLLASELPNAAVAQFTSTDSTTDFNTTTPTAVPWDTVLISNSGIAQPTTSEIQVGEAGLWEFAVNLSFYEPTSLRVAPRLRYWINGVEQSATSQSSYIRADSGHDRSSTSLTAILNLNANDVVEVKADMAGSSGAVELIANESLLGVKKLAGRVATLGDADTLNGKTAADFAVSGHGHSNATTTVDGFMASGDKSKLNGIESGATADQTASEIKTSYESNTNTNAFTDADHTKLNGIEAGAQVNPSSTDALAEGTTNLYYTDVRVNGRIDARVDKAFVDALNVDADTLDGVNGSNYARLDTDNPGAISFSSSTGPKFNAYGTTYGLAVNSSELTLFTGGNVKIRSSAWNGTVQGTVLHTGHSTDSLSEGASNLYFTNARARSAVEAGNLSHIDGVNSHRIRFDSNSSWIEITDQNNNRSDMVTNDLYVSGAGWLASANYSTWGALGANQQAVDSDKLDGLHANDFANVGGNPGFDSIKLNNHESTDFSGDGDLFFDSSVGLYVVAGNANHSSPAAVWSSANVTAGSNISISTDGEDKPTVAVSSSLSSGFAAVSQSLSNGVTVALDLTASNAFSLNTTQNFTLSNPTEVGTNTKGVWFVDVTADASGPYTVTLDSQYTLQDGSLSVEANGTTRFWVVQRAAGTYDVIAEALS